MLLGQKIKKSIDKSGLDPNQVAAFINMSTANLYRIFKRDSVETKYLVKLGELLGVSPSFFFEDSGDSAEYRFEELKNTSMTKNMLNERIAGYSVNAQQKPDLSRFELQQAETKIENLEQRLRDKEEIIELLRYKLKKDDA
jgi:hypothetical protein